MCVCLQATRDLQAVYRNPEVIPSLCTLLQSSPNPQVTSSHPHTLTHSPNTPKTPHPFRSVSLQLFCCARGSSNYGKSYQSQTETRIAVHTQTFSRSRCSSTSENRINKKTCVCVYWEHVSFCYCAESRLCCWSASHKRLCKISIR